MDERQNLIKIRERAGDAGAFHGEARAANARLNEITREQERLLAALGQMAPPDTAARGIDEDEDDGLKAVCA